MSRSSTLIVLGVCGILIPFLGFPSGVRTFFAVIIGAIILGLGVSERAREAREAGRKHSPQMPEETAN